MGAVAARNDNEVSVIDMADLSELQRAIDEAYLDIADGSERLIVTREVPRKVRPPPGEQETWFIVTVSLFLHVAAITWLTDLTSRPLYGVGGMYGACLIAPIVAYQITVHPRLFPETRGSECSYNGT